MRLFYLLIIPVFFMCSCSQNDQNTSGAHVNQNDLKNLSQDSLNDLLCYYMGDWSSVDIRILTEAGADPNCICHYTETFERNVLDQLLAGGGSEGTYYETTLPMKIAFEEDSIALLDFFVKHGGRLDSINISNSYNINMWRYLFTKGFSVKDFKEGISFPFDEYREHIDFLLANDFDINTVFTFDERNFTLSMSMVSMNEEDDTMAFHYLVSKGANINYTPDGYSYPIADVIEKKQLNVFDFFIRHGGDTIIGNKEYGFLNGIVRDSYNDDNYEMVKIAIEVGAEINRIGHHESNMYEDIDGNNPQILSLLVDNGLNYKQYYLFNDDRPQELDPFIIAIDKCSTECLKVLLNRFPEKADKKALIKRLQDEIKTHPNSSGENPKCLECLDILLEEN